LITFDPDVIPPNQNRPAVLSDIFRIRPNGAALQIIFDGQGTMSVHKPIFSPNSRKLLFGCNFDICEMNIDGSDFRHVVQSRDGLENNFPSWGRRPDSADAFQDGETQ
jgi:hypothetical protein